MLHAEKVNFRIYFILFYVGQMVILPVTLNKKPVLLLFWTVENFIGYLTNTIIMLDLISKL
jgi:hypothetical protein